MGYIVLPLPICATTIPTIYIMHATVRLETTNVHQKYEKSQHYPLDEVYGAAVKLLARAISVGTLVNLNICKRCIRKIPRGGERSGMVGNVREALVCRSRLARACDVVANMG